MSLLDIEAIATAAGVPLQLAEHHAPLLALIQAMLPPPAAAAVSAPLPPGLNPHASYTAEEAGVFLGLAKRSVYEIPETELPRTRVGGARTAVRFVGIDLVCYRHKLPLVDWQGVRDEAEEQLTRAPRRSAPSVRPMAGGRTRVL